MWLMLNPSTADASIDDPTIRRCIAFSKAWGYGAMWVGNLYAIRSTDPSILTEVSAAVAHGPENIKHLGEMAGAAEQIICAWGSPGGAHIPVSIRSLLAPHQLWCLGTTKYDAPRHPLYLPAATERQPFPPTASTFARVYDENARRRRQYE